MAAAQSRAGDRVPTTGPTPHPAIDSGTINGASYRIDFPDSWNGGVVVFAHGYDLNPSPPFRPETARPFLTRGFAVAQSRYRAEGWAVREGIEDTEALRAYLVRRYRRPRELYIYGQSMGGMIAVGSTELHPRAYDGALPVCGVLTPALRIIRDRNWAMITTFNFFFPGILGADPGHVSRAMEDAAAAASELQAITRALATRPDTMRALAGRFGMADSVSARNLPWVLQFSAVLVDEVVHHAGGNPVDNQNAVYAAFPDDSALNVGVHRVVGDSAAVAYLARYYTPTGRIRVPVLSLHTTGDPLVPASVDNDYDEVTAAAGTQQLFVAQYVVAANHCQFTDEAIGAAFDELRAWVQSGVRPTGGMLHRASH